MASSRPKTYVYGSVVISLENCVIPKERLERTPSIVDGLNVDVETDLRIVGCEYIQTAGILLKLPQVAMATGQVLFQRFYFSKSFIRHDVEVYAMACLFLAAKIEENPRRIRDVINVFHHIKQRRNHRPIAPMEYLGNTYFTLKNLVIKAERRILKELGFCVHVQHPHKVVITFLQVLDCEKNQPLAQLAWNFMNDALRTNVFVRFQPATIGCACIYLSARQLKIPLPSRPPWWELFDARIEDIEAVCITLLRLYQRPKVSLKVLNAAVEQLKKSLPKKKTSESASTDANLVKSKKGSSSLTFSQPGSPFSNVSPATLSTKSRSEDIKKNGSNKTESQGPKLTKKSSKIPSNRKEIRTQKTSKRPHSPVSDNSRDASETDSDSDDSSDSDSEADSASSPEDNRKRKDKITRRDRGDRHREKHDEVRPISGRKVYKLKSDTNSNRRVRNRSRSPPRRSRSRSPHRRSRSRSRSRSRERVSKGKHGRKGDTKGLQNRNGDYKISDKYDKRSGRR